MAEFATMSQRLSAILLGAAVALIFFTLSTDSLWLDEAFSVRVATTHANSELWAGSIDPRHPPLFYILLRTVIGTLGSGEAWIRLPSALAYVMTIGLTLALSRRLDLAPRTALLAAVLVALAPLTVWYAQEARMYALVTVSALIVAVGLTMNSWAGAAVVAAGLTAGLFLDFTTVPLSLALVGLWSVWWWQRGHPLLFATRVVIALATSAWLARHLWPQLTRLLSVLDRVTVFARLRNVAGVDHVPAVGFLTLLAVSVALIVACAGWSTRLARRRELLPAIDSLVVGSFVVATLVSTIPRGYSAKQIFVCGWPYVALLAAWSLDRLPRLVVTLTVLVSALAGLVTLATPRADWRGVTEILTARVGPGEVVWLDPAYNEIPYRYYRPRVPPNAPEASSIAAVAATRPGAVWLVAERFGKTPPSSPSEAWLDGHMVLAEVLNLSRLEVRRYTPGAATR